MGSNPTPAALMEIVGVIPAAGLGTRLQPLECSKEVLRIGGRPMLEYLAERMRAGGCSRLRIVTRPEKTDVVEHGERLGAEIVLGYPGSVSQSFLMGMTGLKSADIVLLGFPDTIWEPADGYSRLVRAVREHCDIALGLFQIRAEDLPRSDVVVFDAADGIAGIAVKPAEPPSGWIWGCAAARVAALSGMGSTDWPGKHFDLVCGTDIRVEGIRLSDTWLDIGTKESLALAEDVVRTLRTEGPRRGR